MIPEKVKVGGITYDVKETDKALVLNGRECCGIISYEDALIEINNQRN